MSLFTVTGVVVAPGRSPATIMSLQALAVALRERFDIVQVSDRSVEAAASSLTALTFRGRRTHPMIPFERVRLQLDSGNPQQLAFTLNFKMQVVIAVFCALGVGLQASIDGGWERGFTVGAAIAGAFFVLNHLLSRHRAFKWISSEWANALALTGKATSQDS